MIERDHIEAFDEALATGRLTLRNVGDYMYMYTENGKDFFKHIDTREYLA